LEKYKFGKMATVFNNVIVANLDENGHYDTKDEVDAKIDMSRQGDSVVLCVYKGLLRTIRFISPAITNRFFKQSARQFFRQ